MGIRKLGRAVSKVFEPIRTISQKIIPKEVRPALPFLAAATPFMLPGQGFGPGAGIFSGTRGRALLSTLANLGAQAAADPEGEDLNLLSAGLAGLQGLGTTEGFGDTLRGMTTKGQFAGLPGGGGQLLSDALTNRGFFTKAADLGLSGLAKGADLLSGTRETLGSIGRGDVDLFTGPGAKAAGRALALPTAQAVGDLGYTTATAALRDFEKAEAAELAAAGADEAAIANARRAAIREAMEVSGFEEEDILDTFDEIGLKEGGRVGYARGKIVKEGLAALRLFRRPKYYSSDEAKMSMDLIKTGRYTEKELLELDGDQIAEIYEYEGFTPPAPMERSSKIIDTEEIMEGIKNVTPEDMASGGIAGLKDGGMLNFGGKEMDLRGGGFVPIGKKEKADDVPARLSKNEFVMTADAVRAAGGGSVNKGAQRMYNLMNQLEARA